MNRILLVLTTFLFLHMNAFAKRSKDLPTSNFHYYNKGKIVDFSGITKVDETYHLFYVEHVSDEESDNFIMKQTTSKDLCVWSNKSLINAPFSMDMKNRWGVFQDKYSKLGKNKGTYLLEAKSTGFILKSFKSDEWSETNFSFSIDALNMGKVDFPSINWSNSQKCWILTFINIDTSQLIIYKSEDLKNWKRIAVMSGVSSRVAFFEAEKQSYLLVDNSYIPISFKSNGLIQFDPKIRLDYGSGYLQSLILDEQGEYLILGAITSDNYKNDDYSLKCTSPKKLTISEKRFHFAPYFGSLIFDKETVRENKKLIPGLGKNPLSGKHPMSYIIDATLDYNDVSSYGFLFKVGSKSSGYELRYYKKQNIYQCTGGEMAVKPVDSFVQVLAVIDNGFVDFYYNNGAKVMSISIDYVKKAPKAVLFNQGGELTIKSLSVKPIERNEEK
ncbi:hypothetical protein K4L44_14785 [Halosquirtibacter laminarini]|uniref:Uncharacterized protein n=1 Tax=Halosquirtibacter laminarini TaxID=3374600 RepID=A0AC61NE15_9BACT|nr:hypothetical protein K4L44_14785 [Prolixibacteraceae bacterium]